MAATSAWKSQPEATQDEVESWFDEDGRLVKVAEMRRALFRVGVVPSCRHRLWKYLFGIYEPTFTHREQKLIDLENRVHYNALRRRWKAIDDTIALTKDDLYSTPSYMEDSDDETKSESILWRAGGQFGQLGVKKSLSGAFYEDVGDDGSFCLLSPPGTPHRINGYSSLNGSTEGTQTDNCSVNKTRKNLLAATGLNETYSGDQADRNHFGARSGSKDFGSVAGKRSVDSGVSSAIRDGEDGGAGEGDDAVQSNGIRMECCDVRRRRSDDGSLEKEMQSLADVLKVAAQVYASSHKVDTLASYSQSRRTILRDVARTDRHQHYFSHKRNLRKVHRILMIYALFHPEVGYCQGMNDILAVFLLVTYSEVDAYWMFCTYMKDKQLDEDPTLKKIDLVKRLLSEENREMATFIESSECCEMLFCHKWLLVDFKREFEIQDAIHMYEVIRCHNSMSGKVETGHFQLCVCVAILVLHKNLICTKNDAVTIYSTINQLAMHMNLTDVLSKAETIFNKHSKKVFEFS